MKYYKVKLENIKDLTRKQLSENTEKIANLIGYKRISKNKDTYQIEGGKKKDLYAHQNFSLLLKACKVIEKIDYEEDGICFKDTFKIIRTKDEITINFEIEDDIKNITYKLIALFQSEVEALYFSILDVIQYLEDKNIYSVCEDDNYFTK